MVFTIRRSQHNRQSVFWKFIGTATVRSELNQAAYLRIFLSIPLELVFQSDIVGVNRHNFVCFCEVDDCFHFFFGHIENTPFSAKVPLFRIKKLISRAMFFAYFPFRTLRMNRVSFRIFLWDFLRFSRLLNGFTHITKCCAFCITNRGLMSAVSVSLRYISAFQPPRCWASEHINAVMSVVYLLQVHIIEPPRPWELNG